MSKRQNYNRRDFIHNSGQGIAGLGMAGLAASSTLNTPRAAVAGANDRLRVALVGCGGRGPQVAGLFDQRQDVDLVCIADCHSNRLEAVAKKFPRAKTARGIREVLDDKSIDAIINATPVHWHAPGAIAACEAGKHVYVEKPCSHNFHEGRLLVEAARRNQRVVQHGTQVSSTSTIRAGIQLLREGMIGDVVEAVAWNIQRRAGQGRGKPTHPPAGLDYDRWLGPVPEIPYHDAFLSGWNWQREFGTGEIGNDGIHDIEYARSGLGVEQHPTAISAIGGRYIFQNGAHFPDTQYVAFEYDAEGSGHRKVLRYEQRLWSTNYPYNCDSGVEYFGTKGKLFLSRRGKLQVFLDRNQRHAVDVPLEAQNTQSHIEDFVDAIRNQRRANADAEMAHLTAGLCHLGNIATLLGRTLQFDPEQELCLDDDEANRLLSREYRPNHWASLA